MRVSESNTAMNQKGFLGFVERIGNGLPDPVFIFFYLILALIGISVVCALVGVTAMHPTQTLADGSPLLLQAQSLLSAENIQRLWTQMPATFTHFHPLGLSLIHI